MCTYRLVWLEKIGKVCEQCVKDDTYGQKMQDECPVLDIETCRRKEMLVRHELKECPIGLWKAPEDL